MHVFLGKSDNCGRAAYFMGENCYLIGGRNDICFTPIELSAWGPKFIKDL